MGMGWASGEGEKKGKVSIRIIAAVRDHDIHDNDLVQLDVVDDSEDTVSRSLYCGPILLTFSCLQTPESLQQQDALLSQLQISKPKIHNILLHPGKLGVVLQIFLVLTVVAKDLSSTDNSASNATEIIWVATLSTIFNEQGEFFAM
jgi:hypothetical protein